MKEEGTIKNGKALNTLGSLLRAHGVTGIDLNNPESLLSSQKWQISADRDGFISDIKGQELNRVLREIIFCDKRVCDYDAGVYFQKRVGDKVKKGEPIMTLYMGNNNRHLSEINDIQNGLKSIVTISDEQVFIPDNFLLKIYTKEFFHEPES